MLSGEIKKRNSFAEEFLFNKVFTVNTLTRKYGNTAYMRHTGYESCDMRPYSESCSVYPLFENNITYYLFFGKN